jgi:hypothetical protein
VSTDPDPPDLEIRSATQDGAFAPDAVDLEELDRGFRDALRTGDANALPVVGYGEISLAFAWPPEQPTVVAKNLPPFEGAPRFDAYAALLDEYLATLRARGTDPVPTVVRAVVDHGRYRAYVLQPLLPPETIVSEVLRRAGPDEGEALLGAVVEATLRCSDARVGLDAQVSNWAVVDDRLRYLDVSTPLLRSESGDDLLDLGIFLAAAPWFTRGLLRRVVLPAIIADYHDPRRVLRDVAGNLIRERLTRWLPVFLRLANPHLDHPLDDDEVARSYRGNARLWSTVQVLRRADRAWQRHVRGREYPLLLPRTYQR